MPVTFAAFVIAGLGIIGTPGTAGFISKWYLAVGALDITLYRDDLMGASVGIAPMVRKTEIPFSIDGRTIVLVGAGTKFFVPQSTHIRCVPT